MQYQRQLKSTRGKTLFRHKTLPQYIGDSKKYLSFHSPLARRPKTSVQSFNSQTQEIDNKPLGLNHVFNTNHGSVYRILWGIFIFANICICIFHVSDRVCFYSRIPLRTNINVIVQRKVEFPSFTLCPFPGQYPKLKDVQMKIANLTNRNQSDYCHVKLYDIIQFSNLNLSDVWKNTSILEKLDKYLLRQNNPSVFNAPFLDDSKNWSALIKRIEIRNILGTCHTFEIPILPTNDIIWRMTFEIDYSSSCDDRTIFMALHPREDFPYEYFDFNPHYFNRWISHVYKLSIQKYVLISTRTNQCSDRFEVGKCLRDCYYQNLRNGLECKMPNMPFVDIPHCNNSADALKAFTFESQFQKYFDNFLNCSKCQLKCERYTYSINLLHSVSSAKYKKVGLTYSLESNVIVVVNQEYAYPFVTLMCEVGGNLGLFLGLSLVSIVEIFENIFSQVIKRLKFNYHW